MDKMRYEIIGRDRRFPRKESYGKFPDFRSAAYYMESLNRSFGTIVRFQIVEIKKERETK